jgi:hypothetical protein
LTYQPQKNKGIAKRLLQMHQQTHQKNNKICIKFFKIKPFLHFFIEPVYTFEKSQRRKALTKNEETTPDCFQKKTKRNKIENQKAKVEKKNRN